MPRLLILTTLPHRRPESHRFERVNGCHTLRLCAPRRAGLPYGSCARLENVGCVYPAVPVQQTTIGLRLYTSPPHIEPRRGKKVSGGSGLHAL